MIASIGTGLLCVAVLTSAMQALLWGMRHHALHNRLLPAFALGSTLAVTCAFGALMLAFALSDFQVQAVFMHSHTLKPLIFKLAATWGNHEGSILLWCWILTLYTAWMTLATPPSVRKEIATALHVMGVIQCCFIGYTLVTSNPFVELYPAPHEGMGLNPLLQDIGLAMHPPMLYFGYVGFAAAFALAIAGLVHQRNDKHYADFLHPYIMLPWACLTLGIGLGSWWAYRELGWGGWWFWDPVENASLLPWLTATALFHSNKVMIRQEQMQRWVMLLALLTFILSMMGTFLVRSGLLTSVHSFASDPTRGIAILAMIAMISGAGLIIFFVYAPRLPAGALVRFGSREMLVMLNNGILILCMIAILFAMMYPLIYEAYAGRSVIIGTNYYNRVFMLFMLPLVALCGVSSFAVWKHRLPKARQKRAVMYACSSLVLGGVWAWYVSGGWLVWVALSIALWLMISLLTLVRHGVRATQLPMILGHGGCAVAMIAITLQAHGSYHYEVVMHQGEQKMIDDGRMTLNLRAMEFGREENYLFRRGTLEITQGTSQPQILHPEERFYPVAKKFTTEADIRVFPTHDLYATLKQPATQEQETPQNATLQPLLISVHHQPAMLWLWLSLACVAAAGYTALVHKRKKEH